MRDDGEFSTGGEVGDNGCIGAGGKQTAQIITLSSGMEREEQVGRAEERLTGEKKVREWRCS